MIHRDGEQPAKVAVRMTVAPAADRRAIVDSLIAEHRDELVTMERKRRAAHAGRTSNSALKQLNNRVREILPNLGVELGAMPGSDFCLLTHVARCLGPEALDQILCDMFDDRPIVAIERRVIHHSRKTHMALILVPIVWPRRRSGSR